MKAVAAPPSPSTTGRSKLLPSSTAASVELAWILPSRTTSVFTDGSSAPQIRAASSLYGAVTFAPAKPRASNPRTASSSSCGSTGSGTYAQSSPRAAKAAFCIRGRERGRDRIPDQTDEPRLSGNQAPLTGCAAMYALKTSRLDVKKWCILSGFRTKYR